LEAAHPLKIAEDPALNELRFDCLFRVNFRWQGRGILDDPDVIFTFRANAYKAAARAIVGARWIVQERLMLARRYPRRIFGPVAEYFTLQRLPLVLNNWRSKNRQLLRLYARP
jgi:hypothetical protein